MAQTSGKMLSEGARLAKVYMLNSSGTPNASATTYYNGLKVETIKGFALNSKEPRVFTHVGQDRPLGIDYLPATEAMDGEISVGGDEFAVATAVMGTGVVEVGEAVGMHVQTSQSGYEPTVGLLVYQKAIDLDSGLDRWRVFISAAAKMYFMPNGMNDNTTEHRYKVAPRISKYNLWGTALTLADDFCETSQGIFLMTEGKPELLAFKADGTEDEFLFPTDEPAISTSKISVWKNGVLLSAGITLSTTKVTFTSAPTAGDRIVVFYEW